jgi:predicted O-methyltransferase YrrM
MKRFPYLRYVLDQTNYKDIRSLLFLLHIVEYMNPSIVLELGTGRGCSTAFIASGLERGAVVSVDDYREGVEPRLIESNLRACGLLGKVELIIGNTFDVDKLFVERLGSDIKAEIIFMDSSHHYEDMKKEYQALKPIMSEKHILIIDDVFENDEIDFVMDLIKQERYEFNAILPYHYGFAVLVSDLLFLDGIKSAIRKCLSEEK